MKKSFKRMLAALLVAVLCLGSTGMTAYAAPYKMADGNVFDAEYYANTYPDLKAAFGNDFNALYSHYVNNGKAEGRQAYDPATNLSTVPAYTGTTTAATTVTVPTGNGAYLVDANTVKLSATLPKLPASDDKILYVVKMEVHTYAVGAGSTVVAQVPLSLTPAVTFPYEANGLYYKYGFAVKQGGVVKLCTTAQYITNPELLATATKPFHTIPVVSLQGSAGGEMVKFGNYWIDLGHGAGSNTQILQVNNKGTQPNFNHPNANPALDTHPIPNGVDLYMLNNTSQWAQLQYADKLHRIAATFDSQDFIIGNEVNERMWNYVAWTPGYSWEQYVRDYMETFRVCYNAVKSANANARCFVCIDQNWNRNNPVNNAEYYTYIDGDDFLTYFNNMITSEGNINWSLAIHPHPVPLTWAKFWDYTGNPAGAIYKSMKTSNKMVSFENLSVVTNFMTQPAMLSPQGTVRSIIASEVAIPASHGDVIQGAAIYAAYEAVKRNPYVEGIVFYQDPVTGAVFQGKAFEVYANLGKADDAYSAWAKAVIGIADWGQVLR
ncbi:MAG: hypothetical protein IJ589_03650 [Lachnospiraceae bacterium]|nr:hypothetical protein [Lachnospiraceae bacterium]